MRTLTATLIAAASAAAVAGLAFAAQPPAAGAHTMTVRLPDGGVATVTYMGATPPRIEIGPDAQAGMDPAAFFAPTAFAPPGYASGFRPVAGGETGRMDAAESPFAMMQRMSAAMDRQAAAMFAQAAVAQNATQHALLQGGRAGGAFAPGGFSFASAGPGGGYCMQSVEITSNGSGAPTVVRHSAGNCGGGGASGAIGAGMIGSRSAGRAITTLLPRAEPAPAPSAPAPRLYRTEWRSAAPGPAARPQVADATLHTVSDAY